MARLPVLLLASALAAVVLGVVLVAVRASAGPPVLTAQTINGLVDLAGVGPSNPVVLDVPSCATSTACTYLAAKASLGRTELRGIVTADALDASARHLALLRDYGLGDLPDATPSSAGVDLIVAEARRASPERPLLVIAATPTMAAAAILDDPSIANSMIVALTGEGEDDRALEVLRRGIRTVRADLPGGPVPDRGTWVRIERELPPGALRDVLVGSPAVAAGDVVGDAAFALYLHRPYTWRAVESRDGVLRLTAFDLPEATSEWFRTLADPALHGGRPLDPPPAPTAPPAPEEQDVSPSFGASIDFGPAAAPAADGYEADGGAVFGDRGNGLAYGWDADVSADMRQRNRLDESRYDTFAHFSKNGDRTWEIAVPDGTYEVRLVLGDAEHTDQLNRLDVEGVIAEDAEQDNFDAATLTVDVTDGRITIRPAEGAANAKICLVKISQR